MAKGFKNHRRRPVQDGSTLYNREPFEGGGGYGEGDVYSENSWTRPGSHTGNSSRHTARSGSDSDEGSSPDEGWQVPGPMSGLGPRSYHRSGDLLYEEVCKRLTHHGELDASDIEVEVQEGQVTLLGSVDDRRAKRLAEDAVLSVPGVHDVHNRLRLRGFSELS